MTDTRWQCPDCGALVYSYCERCPHCGGVGEGNDAEASNEHAAIAEGPVADQREEAAGMGVGSIDGGPGSIDGGPGSAEAHDLEPHTAVLGAFGSVSKHGTLPPVDWKARHAVLKAERAGKRTL